jgi:predicted GH43/DUF377 family glycosyl hydrolase
MYRCYGTSELLPAGWQRDAGDGAVAIYNPAVIRYRNRLLLAYRVDLGRGSTMQRKIGLCELDATLAVIPGSVRPFSDTIQGGGPRHYDPRFLVYADRLFIHYNNNFQTRPNQIFLVEVDVDTLAARGPARPLALAGARRPIEKNWLFFQHDEALLAVYQIAPHTILRVDLRGCGPIACQRIYSTRWDVTPYTSQYGSLGGGTPPVRQGDEYVSFFHSQQPRSPLHWVMHYWPVAAGCKLPRVIAAVERRLRKPFARKRYFAGVYTFAAAPPFAPRWLLSTPILRPEAELPYTRYRQRPNPDADGIVYPCGALPWHDGRWLVAYGVHDERCCLRLVTIPRPMEGVPPYAQTHE